MPFGQCGKMQSMTTLPHSAAADRNQQPILDVLGRVLGERGNALEIASGTGQHAAAFASSLRDWVWQPTDADASMLPVITRRIEQSGLTNLRPPLLVDVTASEWPTQDTVFTRSFDAIFCANMLHIAPFAACIGLMRGAARYLIAGGLLVTYGPYYEDDTPAPSNLAFDASLRARSPLWGIRRLKDVEAEARRHGLAVRERHEMPANNLLLVFALG